MASVDLDDARLRDAELIVVLGPTASGKTALGLELARHLDGEIVSADSRQVYRGFDIGTAKPTREERAATPHHLIDVAEPGEQLSAGEYARRAAVVIAEIRGRGRRPIVVGGTGLWIRALLYGLPEVPAPDPAIRAALSALSGDALAARLIALDPEAAKSIDLKNPVRVIRALELHALTGELPSVIRARRETRPRYDALLLGIAPPWELLGPRIEARARAMFAAGLVEECRRLLDQGHGSTPAFESIGYPQARAVIEGRCTEAEALAATILATRQYAKRQLTWFRKEPGVAWVGKTVR